MAKIDPTTKKYKVDLLERFMRWVTNEEYGFLSPSPPLIQKVKHIQTENEEHYYKLKEKFDEHPVLERINNLYKFELDKGKGNTPIARYPVYAVLTYNVAYVVGFTGLHYYSYVLRFSTSVPEMMEDYIWKCLFGVDSFDDFSSKRYTGLSRDPVLHDIIECSIKESLKAFRLKPEHDRRLADYTNKLRYIAKILKHKWNKIDDGYISFLKGEWDHIVRCIPKEYIRYINPKSLKFPNIPFKKKKAEDNE